MADNCENLKYAVAITGKDIPYVVLQFRRLGCKLTELHRKEIACHET
jgi:hypothetical protein